MSKQDDLFHSESIDEQIEACSQKQSAGRLSPGTSLISDLQLIEAENREILAQVWTRLAERSPERHQIGAKQNVTQSQPSPAPREHQREEPQTMKSVSTEQPMQKKRRRFLEMLAAVLIVAALVGSMAVVLQTKQSIPTHLGTALHPTPTAQIDTSGLYLSTKSGVDKVSLQTGKVLWHIPLDWAGQPFVLGNSVFFSHEVSNDYFLEAINATTGKQLWRKNYGSSSFVRPVHGILYDSTCREGSNGETSGCYIYAIKPANGALLWSFATLSGTSWITIQENVIYGASYGHLFALNAATGVPLWQKTLSRPNQEISLTPLLLNSMLYAASCNANKLTSDYLSCYILAFSAANGAEIWETPVKTANGSVSQLSGIGGVIYYANLGLVYAADARTGRSLWTYTACTRNCGIRNLVATQHTLYTQTDSSSSSLLTLNLANGSVLWSTHVAPYYGDIRILILNQGLISMITDQYHVKVLDASSGAVIKNYTDGSETITGFTLIPQAGYV